MGPSAFSKGAGSASNLGLAVLLALLAASVSCTSGGSGATTASADIVCQVASGLSAADVSRVTLSITGPGMSKREQDLERAGQLWQGSVSNLPAGVDRVFRGEAFDSAGELLYAGQVDDVTIVAGERIAIVLLLQQTTPPDPFKNRAPIIDGIVASGRSALPGASVDLTVQAHDSDSGDTLSYLWSATAGSFSATTAVSTVWTAPNDLGSETLTIEVRDNRGGVSEASLDLTIRAGTADGGIVTDVNTWPVVSSVTSSLGILLQGEETQLAVTATDADGDALTYAWSSTCDGTFVNQTSTMPRFTLVDAAGSPSCAFNVLVSDGRGGSSSGMITVSTTSVPIVTPDAGLGMDGGTSVAEGGTDASTGTDAGSGGPTQCGDLCPAGTRVGGTLSVERYCRSTNDPMFDCGGVDCRGAFTNSVAPSCTAGVCGHGACDPGWDDCDSNGANGCEANLRSATSCLACGTSCSVGQACTATGCGVCAPPLQVCSGTCANLGSDVEHCGSCGHACGFGETCQGGTCTCTSGNCVAPTVNRCGPNLEKCGAGPTDCMNLATDPDNCGACGNVCPTPGAGLRECVAGVCRPCGAGFTLAGDKCQSTSPYPAAPKVADADATTVGRPFDVDNEWIYSIVGGQVVRTPLAGGSAEPLVTTAIKVVDVAVDDTHLYWSDELGGGIYRKLKGGGDAELVVSVPSPGKAGLLALSSARVCFIVSTIQTASAPKAGGASTIYDASTPGEYYAVTADDDYCVFSLAKNSRTYTNIIVTVATNTYVVQHGGPVYFGDPDFVLKPEINGLGLEQLSPVGARLVPRASLPQSSTIDPTSWLFTMYRADFRGAPFALSMHHAYGASLRAPRCGGAAQRFYPDEIGRMRIGGSYLYFSTVLGVNRIAL